MKALRFFIKIFTVCHGYHTLDIINYNLVYDRLYENYQINFINDVDGIYEYANETIEFVADSLSNVFVTMSKYIYENVIGDGWKGWKISHKNVFFNGYSKERLNNIFKSLIHEPKVSIIDQCDQQSAFIMDSKLLNAIFQGNLAIKYTLVVFAIWDLIVIIKKYDEYADKILRIYTKLETKALSKPKNFTDNIIGKVNFTNTSLKDFLKMPRFISLLFSNSFFLFFKSNTEVEKLMALDDEFNLWKKIFVSKGTNFFYSYCYDLLKIFVTLPVRLSTIIVNINLLQQQYSNNLLVVIFFSFLYLFLSICTPCIIKSFETEPRVYLIQFWLSIFKLVLLSVIMDWFLD